MKAKKKARYETPAMQVVELHAAGALCITSQKTITWTYDQDYFISGYGWGRPGYGDADEF